MRGDGLKLQQGRFRLEIREKFFKELQNHRVTRLGRTYELIWSKWNRLRREVLGSPALEAFQHCREVALRNAVWWAGVGPGDLGGLFQPSRFCDSLTLHSLQSCWVLHGTGVAGAAPRFPQHELLLPGQLLAAHQLHRPRGAAAVARGGAGGCRA